MTPRAGRALTVLAGVALSGLATVAALRGFERAPPAAPPAAASAAPAGGDAARGAYLATVGHCAGCHTARGGAPYAGGTALPTPYGTVFARNLTPDADSGLGRWQAADFRRALHEGVAPGGRRLVPACPYPNFTHVAPADLDDLWAFLRSLPPVHQPARPHALRWPFGTPAALWAWQALWFRTGTPPADRGEALVAGLAHCSACHGRRNAFAATDGALDLRGGALPQQGWIAPALDDPRQAGVAGWSREDVVALLRDGRNAHAAVAGPMAMVVKRSTAHWHEADLAAVADFLRRLPQRAPEADEAAPRREPPDPAQLALGARVYEQHCAGCHGAGGLGTPATAGLLPTLAGNRAVTLDRPDNVIRVVLGGGYLPVTPRQPDPLGMPPFSALLSDAEIAAVVSHVRSAWGHRASAVTALDVNRQRGGATP